MGIAAATRVRIPYKPRQRAQRFHASLARWLCLVLHRRAGKTTAVINHHQRAATDDAWDRKRLRHLKPDVTDAQLKDLLRGRFYAHILPAYRQAKLQAGTAEGLDPYQIRPIMGAFSDVDRWRPATSRR